MYLEIYQIILLILLPFFNGFFCSYLFYLFYQIFKKRGEDKRLLIKRVERLEGSLYSLSSDFEYITTSIADLNSEVFKNEKKDS